MPVGARFSADPSIRAVVLSLEESYDLDSAARDALITFDDVMAKALTLVGDREASYLPAWCGRSNDTGD